MNIHTTIVLLSLFVGSVSVYSSDGEDSLRISDEDMASLESAAVVIENLTSYMDEQEINYRVDPEYLGRWVVPFEGENNDWNVVVSVGAVYTVFVIELIKIPETASMEFYNWLLDTNFTVNQAKFGTENGRLYFNVDIPTRVIDQIEYFHTINSMANYVDGIYPTLLDKANYR